MGKAGEYKHLINLYNHWILCLANKILQLAFHLHFYKFVKKNVYVIHIFYTQNAILKKLSADIFVTHFKNSFDKLSVDKVFCDTADTESVCNSIYHSCT